MKNLLLLLLNPAFLRALIMFLAPTTGYIIDPDSVDQFIQAGIAAYGTIKAVEVGHEHISRK